MRDTRTGDDGEGASGPKVGVQIGAALAAYVATTFILFGDPIKPLRLVMEHDRLSVISWGGPFLTAILVGWRAAWFFSLKAAAFIVGFLVTLVSLTGLVVDGAKLIETRRLAPDRVESSFFIESLHNAPANFQTFVHAAILKDCRAFAWSHRTMSFYELKPNVARNVLPLDWLRQCPNLERER